MTSVFVRGLWGDQITVAREKCLQDVTDCLKNHRHPEPTIDYCFGEANRDFLKSQGLDPIMLAAEPVVNFAGVRDRQLPAPSGRGTHWISRAVELGEINYGVRFWYHKLQCIVDALGRYDQITWLDWDVWQMTPLPGDYWEQRAAAKPIQATMRALKHGTFPWRTFGGGDSPHGGVIYCRDATIIKALLTLQYLWPLASDEHLLSLWAELQWGQWTETERNRWYSEGWEFPNYRAPKQILRPRMWWFAHKGNGRR